MMRTWGMRSSFSWCGTMRMREQARGQRQRAPVQERLRAGGGKSANASAQAQKLIEQAFADIQKMDLYNAKDLLDQAQKLSPDHANLWGQMGYLELRNGQTAKGLADYKKELTLHPEEFQGMDPAIIQLELVLGQRADAKDTLRAWMKADPVDPAPVTQLLRSAER